MKDMRVERSEKESLPLVNLPHHITLVVMELIYKNTKNQVYFNKIGVYLDF